MLMLVLAGGWLALGSESPRAVDGAAERVARANMTAVAGPRAAPGHEREATAEPRRAKSRSERDVLRRRILDALEERGRIGVADEREAGESERSPVTPTRKAPSWGEDVVPDRNTLIDQTGTHGYLMTVMKEELLPLADECYALARHTTPDLTGMLVLDFEFIGDEDLGGVVESVAPGTGNEITDPQMLECMRESILSTTLPPPPQGGRDAIALSIPLAPDAGE